MAMVRVCCAVIATAALLTITTARAETIEIPVTAPGEAPPSSLAGYPAPATANIPAPANATGSLAYPKPETTPQPEFRDAGAGMALHPGPVASGRKRPGVFNSANTTRKVVALTFDDGPHPKLTPQLLDLLKRENVHATFFVLGSLVAANPQIVQRMAAEGHEVANHSWDHPRLPSLKEEKFDHQIRDTTAIIEKNTGKKVTLMRPTYGLYNERVKNDLISSHGLDIILWSVDPNDWKKPGADVVARRLVNGAHPGAILLSHDIHAGTIAAMPQVIAQLKAKGYTFATVSELLAMDETPAPSTTPAVLAKETKPMGIEGHNDGGNAGR